VSGLALMTASGGLSRALRAPSAYLSEESAFNTRSVMSMRGLR